MIVISISDVGNVDSKAENSRGRTRSVKGMLLLSREAFRISHSSRVEMV